MLVANYTVSEGNYVVAEGNYTVFKEFPVIDITFALNLPAESLVAIVGTELSMTTLDAEPSQVLMGEESLTLNLDAEPLTINL